MTRTDRQDLIKLAQLRARTAKAQVKEREKVLLAEVEDTLNAEFSARDELWVDAISLAEAAVCATNDKIREECAVLGIPAADAPHVNLAYYSRTAKFSDPQRRNELRKLAQTRLTALSETAKASIDARALEVETTLTAGGLESGEAKAFLEAMPTVEELMPTLSLGDLGVKHWQPPRELARDLLTPSTPADMRRKQILQAIEQNPDASNRQIAAITGFDHHTVGKYRAQGGESAGELVGKSPAGGEPAGEILGKSPASPAADGEVPSDNEEPEQ
jgi:hypothetical protein